MADRRALGLLCCLGLALASCSESEVVAGAGSSGPRTDPGPEDPAEFGPLPAFTLVSERGEPVALADLRGRPLVISVLYSTCSGPCPSVAAGLEELQEDLADTDVLLVTVSVDPEVDTPQVLASYGRARGARSGRWIFLTGEESQVHRLVREGFYLAVERAPGDEVPPGERVTHDTRLLAVDRSGRRRGWYSGTDPVQLEKLRRRMRFLAAEGQPPLR